MIFLLTGGVLELASFQYCEILENIFQLSHDFSFLVSFSGFMQLILACLQKIPKPYKGEILSLERRTGECSVSKSQLLDTVHSVAYKSKPVSLPIRSIIP